VTAPVKVLITQQLNGSEILFSAHKQSIGAQRKRKRINSSLFHSSSNNEIPVRVQYTHYIHMIFFNMKEEKRERETKREYEKERMSKPITNGGRNPLSRKWNSFSGFSVFDRPFVYHSMNGSLDLEGSITPTSNVSMSTVISVIQLLSTKPWISISSVLPNISIERPLSAHSSDEFLPFNRQYSWSVHAKIVTVRTALMIHM